MSDMRTVVAMLVGSASLRLSFRDYKKDYIAFKAAEVAKKIVETFKVPDQQVMAAHILAANYGHTMPGMTQPMIEDAIRDTQQWMSAIDEGFEQLAKVEAEQKAEELKKIADEAEAKAREEEAILRKAEEIAAKKAAEEAEQRKQAKAAEGDAPDVGDKSQQPSAESGAQGSDNTTSNASSDSSDPTMIAIADLPIPKKQKAELIAAGLATGADILKYDAEYASENGIERLKEIGPAARKVILDLLK
jgi:primosomal protein N'